MQLLRQILPAPGGMQLAKLTVLYVQKFYAQMLQKGLSPQSVRLLHEMLHKALDYAVHVDLLPRNICESVSPPRIEKRETRALSLEQSLRLLETARGHRMEALYMLALVTGMRRGEIVGLKWSDVNLAEGVISVQRSLVELKGGIIESNPKSSRGYRSIILPPFDLEFLKKHRERQELMRQGAKVAGKRLCLPHLPRYPVCNSEPAYRVQSAVKEGTAAGYSLPRLASQRGDALTRARDATENRAGTVGTRKHRHDIGHLFPRHATDAERGNGETECFAGR
jgi:integrase